MTVVPYFQINAFTDKPYGGNPAGVFVLDRQLPDDVLQALTVETRMPIAAFLVESQDGFRLRWFTPNSEEDMCGHGTLAAAWVVFNHLRKDAEKVAFNTRAGVLDVERRDRSFVMHLPLNAPQNVAWIEGVEEALGIKVEEFLFASYNIAVLRSGRDVQNAAPDLEKVAAFKRPGLIITSTGEDFGCDIVTRYFAPAKGIPEDVATGSAHAQIIPYWQQRLQLDIIRARQLSSRGGEMICQIVGNRLRITASVTLFLTGEAKL
jgi:PhzF family phenazine biosynthesis protein